MSSRPNSSRNHQKSMYSSLPSASKIYVCTAKSKQKNIHSARRKRKKSEPDISVAENISDETLISLTSPIKSSSQIALKAEDSPRNVGNKVSKALRKEGVVKNLIQPDESDSDSYTLDDKVKVVNTYFDVCIESDEFNEEPGTSCIESDEMSSDGNKMNVTAVAESAHLALSAINSNNLAADAVIAELSKTIENSVSELHQSYSMIESEEKMDPESLKNETLALEEVDQESISKELSCLALKNGCPGDDSLKDFESKVPMTDVKLEINESTVKNISEASDCKNANLKNEIEEASTVESEHESLCLPTVMHEDSDKVEEENNNPYSQEISEFKCNVNEVISSQATDETSFSKDYSEQDSCTESELIDLNTLSDHCNELNIETGRESNITFLQSNANSQIDLFPLKRSISLPEILRAQEKMESSNINVDFNSTLSSDKATNTSDSSTVNSDKQLKNVDKNRAFRDSDCNTVATGGDVPIVEILPILTMLKAKMRNYVFGCKGSDGALLGSEELSRFFPNNKITVFVGTWNMNGQDPPENIDDFLLPHDSESLPDVYAIGIQESMQSKSQWELLLQTTLGPSHVLFTSTSLGVLHLAIFLRRDLIWFCSEPEDANVATRVGSMVKTKGAVAICFMLFGTSFLFINSHLTAHEQNLVDRISDYEKICSGLDLPKNIPSKTSHQNKNVTSRFDCVFWCGDLNFRIMWNRPAVLRVMKERDHSDNESCSMLLKHDQLQKVIKEGAAFHGFQEGFINFDPSFKFDVGTNAFDSTKLRVPSYTDRILYRFKDSSSISCLHYNSVPEMVTSDHKPVYGIFSVSLKPGRDDVPLAAGIFKRDVYLEALKRRANFLEVNRNHKQSAVCSMM